MSHRSWNLWAAVALALVLIGAGVPGARAGDEPAKKEPKKAGQAAAHEAGSAPAKKVEEPPVSPIFEAARKPAASGETQVYTNEDLERMMANLSPEERRKGVYQAKGPAVEGGTAAPEGAPGGEPGAPSQPKEPAAQEGTETQAASAEARVAALQKRVAELERSVMAIKNPLLPKTWRRPEGGKTQEGQEAESWEGLDNTQRLDKAEEQLRQAREELRKAQEELAGTGGGN